MNCLDNHSLRAKALQIYRYIGKHLYLNRPDMTIAGEDFNTALLMGLLVGLCRGKALIIGEPGLGKTTFVEYLGSLLHRIPLGIIWQGEVSGHPEQTEEKIIGRPDLGKLNLGEEVVIWSYFTLLPVKIVDEINRLPETKQSMILNGVDRGNWEYLNDAIINREYCLFATANYEDRGTNTIIAPLMDRFDLIFESRHPGANLSSLLGANGKRATILRHEKLEAEFQRVLSQPIPYEGRIERLNALSDQFGDFLSKEANIPSLTHAERCMVADQKSRIPFDVDFNAFLRLVIAELSFCHHYGQKRSNELCQEGCHFSGYLCRNIKNCISNRFPMSVGSLARALAWLLGDEAVGLQHLEAVLPYSLAHRIQWKQQVIAESEKQTRQDPLEIHMAKKAVQEMLRRYREQAHRIQQALATASRIKAGERQTPVAGDHPLFHEIQNDLGQEAHNMINPFLDFTAIPIIDEAIPLERFVRTNRQVIDALLSTYHCLDQESVKELCRLLDHGQRFSRYKSMLPGLELPKFLTSTLTNAAAVYEGCLRLIQPILYAPDDLEEFCAIDELANCADLKQTGPLGLYLSALINGCKERDFDLHIHHLQSKLHFLGFRLEADKHLSVHGDVGHFTGAGLRGGHLKVSGSTGSWCGADMSGGHIEITGEAHSKTGAQMKGGQIQVNGGINEIAKDRRGGEIQSRHER